MTIIPERDLHYTGKRKVTHTEKQSVKEGRAIEKYWIHKGVPVKKAHRKNNLKSTQAGTDTVERMDGMTNLFGGLNITDKQYQIKRLAHKFLKDI